MPSGRTRRFDVDEALDWALEVFCECGYEGAALPSLTAAVGINRPSLHAASGDKEQPFRKARDHYRAGPRSFLTEAMSRPTAPAVVEVGFSGFPASRPPSTAVRSQVPPVVPRCRPCPRPVAATAEASETASEPAATLALVGAGSAA
jgi:hypothetical protein